MSSTVEIARLGYGIVVTGAEAGAAKIGMVEEATDDLTAARRTAAAATQQQAAAEKTAAAAMGASAAAATAATAASMRHARAAAGATQGVRMQRMAVAENINILSEMVFALGMAVPSMQSFGVQAAMAGNTTRTLAMTMGVLPGVLIGIGTVAVPALIGALMNLGKTQEDTAKKTDKAAQSMRDYARAVREAERAANEAALARAGLADVEGQTDAARIAERRLEAARAAEEALIRGDNATAGQLASARRAVEAARTNVDLARQRLDLVKQEEAARQIADSLADSPNLAREQARALGISLDVINNALGTVDVETGKTARSAREAASGFREWDAAGADLAHTLASFTDNDVGGILGFVTMLNDEARNAADAFGRLGEAARAAVGGAVPTLDGALAGLAGGAANDNGGGSMMDGIMGRGASNPGARIVEEAERAAAEADRVASEAFFRLVDASETAAARFADAWRRGVDDVVAAFDEYNDAAQKAGQQTATTSQGMAEVAKAAGSDIGNQFFDRMSSGMGQVVGALIDGEKDAKKAFASMAREALKALAMEATVQAIFQTAQAIAAFASYRYDQGAQHLAAAAIYAAAAAAAGAAASAIPKPSTGAGQSREPSRVPERPRATSGGDGGDRTWVVNVGTFPLSNAADIGRAVGTAIDAADRRDGRRAA